MHTAEEALLKDLKVISAFILSLSIHQYSSYLVHLRSHSPSLFLQTAQESSPSHFIRVLCFALHHYPHLTVGNADLVYLIVSSVDPAQVHPPRRGVHCQFALTDRSDVRTHNSTFSAAVSPFRRPTRVHRS